MAEHAAVVMRKKIVRTPNRRIAVVGILIPNFPNFIPSSQMMLNN